MFVKSKLPVTLVASLVGSLVAAALLTATTASASAQPLPSPRDYVSGLDLECYKTPGPALNQGLTLTHLNPVLLALGLPAHQVMVRELEQTCVPVRKNNGGPNAAALPFVARTDFACYRLEAAPLPQPQPLALSHLNPQLQALPNHGVQLTRPAQLCVPIAKNNQLPPAAVGDLVRFLDLECWETIPGAHPNFALLLTQLNPLLVNLIPPHQMNLTAQQRQLCVPVRKNQQFIPAPSLNIIQWVDVEKFPASPNVVIATVNLMLRHLNPLLVNLAQVPVQLKEANALMVPVAKNGQLPPVD